MHRNMKDLDEEIANFREKQRQAAAPSSPPTSSAHAKAAVAADAAVAPNTPIGKLKSLMNKPQKSCVSASSSVLAPQKNIETAIISSSSRDVAHIASEAAVGPSTPLGKLQAKLKLKQQEQQKQKEQNLKQTQKQKMPTQRQQEKSDSATNTVATSRSHSRDVANAYSLREKNLMNVLAAKVSEATLMVSI